MLCYFIGKLVGKRMESHLHAERYESVMGGWCRGSDLAEEDSESDTA